MMKVIGSIFALYFFIHAVCAVVYPSPNTDTAEYWLKYNERRLQTLLRGRRSHTKAKNIIIFIGDGMGIQTVTAGRIYKGQQQKGVSGEEEQLVWDNFPHTGFSKTYNTDKQVPDSAGTATALFSAVKTKYGVVGLDSTTPKDRMDVGQVDGIMTWAQKEGKRTGFVTTTRITHATPACLYAHTPNRDAESNRGVPIGHSITDIARQLVENEPGNKLNVIMGGGRETLGDPDFDAPEIPYTFSGKMELNTSRTDDMNLADTWLHSKDKLAFYVRNRTELNKIDTESTDYLLGLFANSHMTYDYLRKNYTDEPSLAEMTVKAIEILTRNDSNGYVLMVEGGKIDHAHHQNFARLALHEVMGLDAAVEAALKVITDDTLIIVTADHSHAMTFNGYPTRGNDILGFGNKNDAVLAYETLTYANGPGFLEHRAEKNMVGADYETWIPVQKMDRDSPVYRHLSALPLGDETHGGEDVPIYANGPGSHLIKGSMEQCFIAYVMSYAGCMGPAAQFNEACYINEPSSSSRISMNLILLLNFLLPYFLVRNILV